MFQVTRLAAKATTLGRKVVNNVEKGKLNPENFSKQLDTFYKNALDTAPSQKTFFKKIKAWFIAFRENIQKAKANIKDDVEHIKLEQYKDNHISKTTKKDDKKFSKTVKKFVLQTYKLQLKNLKTEIKSLKADLKAQAKMSKKEKAAN